MDKTIENSKEEMQRAKKRKRYANNVTFPNNFKDAD